MEKKIKSTNEKENKEMQNKEMQNKKRVDRLSAYRNRIEELMECLEDIVDELDELQEEMEDDNEIQFPPLDENGEEIREDSIPPMNVTICVMPEGKNFTLPIEMIRRMLDEH